jgi:hypothetical protein
VQLTLKELKFKILNVKALIFSGCMSLFKTSIAQYVLAYLAIISCIKIVEEIGAILYTVVTRVAIFS